MAALDESAKSRDCVGSLTAERRVAIGHAVVEGRGQRSVKYRRLIWLAAVTAGLAQTVAYRHQVITDGVSYLDIARSCEQGHWHALVV
jgi:hypothetical protein